MFKLVCKLHLCVTSNPRFIMEKEKHNEINLLR